MIFITHILKQITVFYLIQDIAERMGFDTRKSSSLWKDRTLVEINVAVLYSFQVGFTITIVRTYERTRTVDFKLN